MARGGRATGGPGVRGAISTFNVLGLLICGSAATVLALDYLVAVPEVDGA